MEIKAESTDREVGLETGRVEGAGRPGVGVAVGVTDGVRGGVWGWMSAKVVGSGWRQLKRDSLL